VLKGYESGDIGVMAPRISPDIHKGSRGALIVLGGSATFRGAPVLAALAALRAGCGLVCLAVPESLVPASSSLMPEAIFVPLPERGGHVIFDGLGDAIAPFMDRCGAMVLGPGLGRSLDAERVAKYIFGEWQKPLVLDADALHFSYSQRRPDVVATPHAGEAAHILGVLSSQVYGKRLSSTASLAAKFGVVLLKGPHTLISDGSETRVILEGGPELAVPGSGDVLSGVIGAYLAAGMKPIDAATLGALVHSASGRRAALGKPELSGILARELADNLAVSEEI
jgi:NAD(P)H-hydrate epimerase